MRLALSGARGPLAATVTVAAVTALVATPIGVVVARIGADSGGLWEHLAQTVLPDYLRNTLWLALGVGVLTTGIGVATAWLVTLCRFPGQRVFRWALLLPLAIPTYLCAYAYTDLLQFSGPVQSWLRATFGWTAQDYAFPEIRSLGGAIVVLSLGLYPYVFLAARTAFVEQSVCVLEVGRTLGLGPWRSFARIALPLARPSILAGLSLVLMETLAEFGAVHYFAVDTFATGIYRTFTLPDRHALTAAAQLSACLLLLVALLLGVEALARRTARFYSLSTRHRALPSWPLSPLRAALAIGACSLPIILGFVVPLVVFALKTWRGGDARARETFLEIGRNSFVLALGASLLAVLLALFVACGRRLRTTPITRLLARTAGIGYAIPGAVIAIGVLIPMAWLDRRLGDLLSPFGVSAGLLLSGTAFAVVYGYQVRFLAVSLNLLQASMTRIRPTLDDAARMLGRSPLRTVASVHLPMLRGSLFAAALLVFVDVIKELPATLILRPFDFDTLAVRVYQLASDERLAEASTGALAIILVGLIPVIVLSRMLDRSRPGGVGGSVPTPNTDNVFGAADGAPEVAP
ncbi:MAG: iron ABC transporter permease [Acidobacteriota bacterium]